MNTNNGSPQHNNRWQRAVSESTFVSPRVRNLVSWLLILIISTGPFQSSIAMHFDMNAPAQNNQVLVTQPQEAASTSDSQSCIANFCQSFSTCATHLNCNPVASSSPPQLSAYAQFFYQLLIGDVSVSTRFPDLLKRPPKS
jgi:hypothetical protein